ncbi:hypothetical protein D3C85_1310960 [compost metagenome]
MTTRTRAGGAPSSPGFSRASKSGSNKRSPVLLIKATAMSTSLALLIAAHRCGRKWSSLPPVTRRADGTG